MIYASDSSLDFSCTSSISCLINSVYFSRITKIAIFTITSRTAIRRNCPKLKFSYLPTANTNISTTISATETKGIAISKKIMLSDFLSFSLLPNLHMKSTRIISIKFISSAVCGVIRSYCVRNPISLFRYPLLIPTTISVAITPTR